MRGLAVLFALLVLASCGSSDAPGGDVGASAGLAWFSGTRLRAVLDVVAESRTFAAWQDLQLGVRCRYVLAADGKLRCLPDAPEVSAMYDDATCAHAVGVVPPAVATPKYLPAPDGPFVCGAGTDFFVAGAPYTPPAVYQRQYDGTCQAQPIQPDATYLALGARVDPATFAGETDEVDPRGARYTARRYRSDDGARQDVDLLDGSRGDARCAVRDDGADNQRCVPSDLAYIETQFSDATCKTPIAFYPGYAQRTCARTPTAILDSTIADIGKPLALFEAGALFTGVVYRDEGMCTRYDADPSLDASYYTVGAAVSILSLPVLPVTREGSGRIQLQVARTESGALAAVLGRYDTERDTVCDQGRASDGTMRCLPHTNIQVAAFADAQCTHALAEVGAVVGSYISAPAAMPGTIAIFQVSATTMIPTTSWRKSGTDCVVAVDPTPPTYRDTTTIAPADLVAFTTIVE